MSQTPYPFLRMYGTLSEAQRRQALAGGLRLDQMSPVQRQEFLYLTTFYSGRKTLEDPALAFRMESAPPRKPSCPGDPWSAGIWCSSSGGFDVSYTPRKEEQRHGARTPAVAPRVK